MTKYLFVALSCALTLNSYAENIKFKGYIHNQNMDDDIIFVANPVVLGMPIDTVKIHANQLVTFYIECESNQDTVFTFHAIKKSTSKLLGSCRFILDDINVFNLPDMVVSNSGQAECNVHGKILTLKTKNS